MIANPPSGIGSAVKTTVRALPCLTAFVTASRMISTISANIPSGIDAGNPRSIFRAFTPAFLRAATIPEMDSSNDCDTPPSPRRLSTALRTSAFALVRMPVSVFMADFTSSGTSSIARTPAAIRFAPARCCSIVSCRSAAMRRRSAATAAASRRSCTFRRQSTNDVPMKNRIPPPRMHRATMKIFRALSISITSIASTPASSSSASRNMPSPAYRLRASPVTQALSPTTPSGSTAPGIRTQAV